MTIVVHHLERSRSLRVLWLLHELGLPHEIRRYRRDNSTYLAPPGLKQVHPLGKAPVITVDGQPIAETGAIVEYLIEQAGGRLGPPADDAGRMRYRHFLHYAEGSLMSALIVIFALHQVGPEAMTVMDRRQRMLAEHLDWLESELQTRDWFAGDSFTAADVMMSFPLEVATVRGGLDASRPRLMAFLERVHSRPAYIAAVAEAADPQR
ncbi:glutathione S-transferase protein [Acetobacteraceae bacterium AT-5844]|nr:glutathione S-transferase protein [Acetobacteraceae bacterium AT-5844]